MTRPEPGNGHHGPTPPRPELPPHTDSTSGPVPADDPAPASAADRPGSRLWFILALAVVAFLLVGLVAWLLATANLKAMEAVPTDLPSPGSVVTTTVAPPTALPLPREAAPVDFRLGDCFSDFRPDAQEATIVACDTPHSAQFVANFTFQDDEGYPGTDALRAKALEACQAVTLSPAAARYVLNFERVYPSSTSWDVGDRRVDCFVVAPEGNIMTSSVLP